MPYRFNPFTNTLDFTPDLSGYVPYTGATANVDLSSFFLLAGQVKTDNISDYGNTGGGIGVATGVIKDQWGESTIDWKLRYLYDASSILSFDYNSRKAFNSTDGTNPTINYEICTLFGIGSGVPSVDWTNRRLENSLGYSLEWDYGGTGGVRVYNSGTTVMADFSIATLYDTSGVRAVHFGAGSYERSLYDFSGNYPSVDFGNYGLFNIGITNNGPLLDWSNAAGGVRIYSYYSGGYHNSGDFVGYILNNPAGPTLDWANRYLIKSDNTTSIDWEQKLLYSNQFGGVIALDYGQHFLNNGGGFLSIDFTSHIAYDQGGTNASIKYHDRQLFASDGTTIVLNWTVQQTTSVTTASLTSNAGTALTDTDTFDGYTLGQVVAALRVYGLLA